MVGKVVLKSEKEGRGSLAGGRGGLWVGFPPDRSACSEWKDR